MSNSSNIAPLIKELVSRLVGLKQAETTIKVRRKAISEDLKGEGFSASVLMQLVKQDDDKVEKKHEALKKSAAVLGVAAYTEETDLSDLKDSLNPEVVELVLESVGELKDLEADLKSIKDDMKDVGKLAKSNGLVPSLISTLADFQIDPELATAHTEHTLLLDAYLNAIK